MEMRVLGRSGVQVSAFCLGAMMFGQWGNPDHDDCIAMMHAAFDAGINFVDTADVYSAGESEEIVGKAVKGRRDDIVIATKFMGVMGQAPNMGDASRRWIIRACEQSLRRLGTDYIDLYQIHRPSNIVDIDETLGALSDLIHQGKVRNIGHSTFPADYIVEAQWTSEKRNRERFVSEQPPYSILMRGIERFVLPACERYGIGVIPWSPLAGGWLAGRYRRGQEVPPDSRIGRGWGRGARPMDDPANQRRMDAVEQLVPIAEAAGLRLTHMAHAFVLEHLAVTSAIIGPRTRAQLDDVLAGADVRLDSDTLDAIDTVVPPGTDLAVGDPWQPPGLRVERRRRLASGGTG
jgi:aryl-alcohol dehydrogenase-like predicted oxidoreductase